MDERCERLAKAEWDSETGRCWDCGHAIAVHGYDNMCDVCSLERRVARH